MKNSLKLWQQLLIFAGLTIATLVLFVYFAWTPQSNQLARIGKERVAEEQKIEAARATLAKLERTKRNAPKTEAKIVKIGRKMPSEPELPSLIVQLQNIANDAGISIIRFSPSEPKALSGYGQLDVSIEYQGTYQSIDDFLYRLENSPRAMRVDNFNIGRSSGQPGYPLLRGSMTISTFVLNEVTKQAPLVPPVNAPAGATTSGTGASAPAKS